ncbi:CMGC protein kinase [Boeremia exigua]|uniref:CMGC protein kinase n=1 Tax=Boeremia exigua TaxID=749465 RepID=UPI001E8D0E90|nr:CMGC protein kinase [Boeremia exigua]KAH6622413.1 CMGC protein kinase [Boeremia exigua]
MGSIFKCLKNLFRRPPWPKLNFPVTGFETISEECLLEEERLPSFRKTDYYPVNIGDVFASRYQVVGKLGFGVTSTVWLARDLPMRKYATLKIYRRYQEDAKESEIYKALRDGDTKHWGYQHIRTAQNTFKIARPGGDHLCLVQEPMGDSLSFFQSRIANRRFSVELLRMSLVKLFLALDYLHNECKLVHTDIKLDNIFLSISDKGILEDFVKEEMSNPSARKLGEYPVYASRGFKYPNGFGDIKLGDFGAAERGDKKQTHGVQPAQIRCPEILFDRGWSYPADIWNVGVLVWELYENKIMFSGQHPDGSGYAALAHAAEMIAVLGPPPKEWLADDPRNSQVFDAEGQWIGQVPVPTDRKLEDREENLTGDEQKEFLDFMRCMLQWRPEDRMTANQLVGHPWLKAKELLGIVPS